MTVHLIRETLQEAGIKEESLNHLTTIITKLLELQAVVDTYQEAADKIKKLPRCCGSEYVDPGGYYYANHGKFDNCPLHGQHPTHPGHKRLKKYLGKDEAEVELFQTSLENWANWQKALLKVHEAQKDLKNLQNSIKRTQATATGNGFWY